MRVVVRNVAAWAAGPAGNALETRDDWSRWATHPTALGLEGQPEVRFLPAGVRRRASRLTRMTLQAAFDCTEGIDRSRVRTVFASRHGAIHIAVKILASIARGEAVSPLQFSHSVHNAQAGLFSISAGNREASSSIAGEADTFGQGFLEAILSLERKPDVPVLLVTSDEPIPDNLAHLVTEPRAVYAVAILLARSGEGAPLEFSLGTCDQEMTSRDWPDALEFMRFFCSGSRELTLDAPRHRWHWKRLP